LSFAGEIHALESDVSLEAGREGATRARVAVAKEHLGALGVERANERAADAVGAARDQDRATFEFRERHAGTMRQESPGEEVNSWRIPARLAS
jgi:hypothetical protein